MSAEPIEASFYAALADLFGIDGERYAWRAYAACKTRPDLDWFPGRGVPLTEQKKVCASCPVKDACLEAALRNGEKDGVWGGTSERERRAIRREQGIKRRMEPAAVIVNHLAELGGTWRGASARELAAQLGMYQQTAAQAICRLEEEGRITVDPPAPRVGRMPVRTITLNRSSNP